MEESALVYMLAQELGKDTEYELSALFIGRGCAVLAVAEMEKAIMKHFRDPLTWWQLALACITAKHYERGLLALNECDALLASGTKPVTSRGKANIISIECTFIGLLID